MPDTERSRQPDAGCQARRQVPLHALYLLLLLSAAAGFLYLPDRLLPLGAVFAALAVCAHAAAGLIGVSGTAKAMLFLEALPFFGLAVVHLGQLEAMPALALLASSCVAGAALLAGEWLLVKGAATFTTSLAFIGACCAAGWGLEVLSQVVFSGLALLSLGFAGYGVARRVRG